MFEFIKKWCKKEEGKEETVVETKEESDRCIEDEEIKKLLIKTKKMHSKHYQDLLNILQ